MAVDLYTDETARECVLSSLRFFREHHPEDYFSVENIQYGSLTELYTQANRSRQRISDEDKLELRKRNFSPSNLKRILDEDLAREVESVTKQTSGVTVYRLKTSTPETSSQPSQTPQTQDKKGDRNRYRIIENGSVFG